MDSCGVALYCLTQRPLSSSSANPLEGRIGEEGAPGPADDAAAAERPGGHAQQDLIITLARTVGHAWNTIFISISISILSIPVATHIDRWIILIGRLTFSAFKY